MTTATSWCLTRSGLGGGSGLGRAPGETMLCHKRRGAHRQHVDPSGRFEEVGLSRANRLAVLVLVPPIVLLGIVVYVTSAAPETRLATLGVSVLVVVASALAGRSFFVWAQKAMVKKWAAWEAENRQVGNHSGRLALVFAASAFGAVLGPARDG